MYEQLDGILAWGELISVGSAASRSPWYLYMGSKTALCSSTWPLCASTWAHETSKRPPRPILERFRTPLGGSGSLSGNPWEAL